jgi:hypothetical protein
VQTLLDRINEGDVNLRSIDRFLDERPPSTLGDRLHAGLARRTLASLREDVHALKRLHDVAMKKVTQ